MDRNGYRHLAAAQAAKASKTVLCQYPLGARPWLDNNAQILMCVACRLFLYPSLALVIHWRMILYVGRELSLTDVCRT